MSDTISTVLVVDDEEFNRDILNRRLSKKNYNILEASSGDEALSIIENQNVDMVLLDIRMPGKDGNEVLREIRSKYQPTELPVIMVTAESDTNSLVNSMGLGADDYVTKPIDFKALLARMENKIFNARAINHKLAQIDQTKIQSNIERIAEIIAHGETENVEFKSTLRWNIFAGKVGKEIEIASMKTLVAFLNTDGGILLVGVDDDGVILGNELDKFENDDKYLLHVNSMIQSYIGMNYISHIHYELLNIEEKSVLFIECRAHDEPVFLRKGQEEEFYVRFGPSSRKLKTREVLEYLNKRSRK